MSGEAQHLNPTMDTKNLIDRWVSAGWYLESLKSQVNLAECELTNATNEIGRHLAPKDAKHDEVFHIWYSNGLLEAKKVDMSGNGSFKVSWRQMPSEL